MPRKITKLSDYLLVPGQGVVSRSALESVLTPGGRLVIGAITRFEPPKEDNPMPMFNKRHYEAVADALKAAREKSEPFREYGEGETVLLTVATTLADVFRQDNPKFDTSKFLKRIGIS